MACVQSLTRVRWPQLPVWVAGICIRVLWGVLTMAFANGAQLPVWAASAYFAGLYECPRGAHVYARALRLCISCMDRPFDICKPLYVTCRACRYVSRGAAFWGPPMRSWAPMEVAQITLRSPAAKYAGAHTRMAFPYGPRIRHVRF